MLKISQICVFLVLCSCDFAERSQGIVTFLLRHDFRKVEGLVLSACRKNNPDIADGLQEKQNEATRCFFTLPKEDPMEKIVKCTAALINQTTSCLDEKYFPQILFDYVREFYFNEPIHRGNTTFEDGIQACSKTLNTGSIDKSISDCVGTYDKGGIPATKDIFCDALTHATKCISDAVNTNCNLTSSVHQLKKKFEDVAEYVCRATDAS